MIVHGPDQLDDSEGATMEQQVTVTAAAAPITAADQARIERYVEKSRSLNTRAQYRSAWRAWVAWCAEHGHATLPADPAAVAAYLTHRADQGAAAATVRVARAAIAAAHRDAGVADPTRDHEGVARTVQGIARDAVGRGRGQAQPLTADGLAAIIATASFPRRTGRGLEADVQAQQRGTVDKAIAGLLFQGGLRRSEAAALRWADVRKAADGRGLLVQVRRSKTDQEGTAADVRYLKNGAAVVVWAIRPPSPADDAPVLGGLNGQSVARRLAAAARAAGIEGRITGHSGRVGLASELTARGASTTETMLAGGWKTARMVAHYSAAATAEQGAVAKYL